MQSTFWEVHISVHCSLLASFCETTKSYAQSLPVKALTVPSALHVPCAVDVLVVFKRHFQQRLARLKLTLGYCNFAWFWNVSFLRLRTSVLQSSTARLLYHHSKDHTPIGGVYIAGWCCLLSVHYPKRALVVIWAHLLASLFSKDSHASNENCLFLMLHK